MAMILDAFMSKCSTLLNDFVKEEVIMVLGVKGELQKLQQRMLSIQRLLQDAEKRKFNESSIDLWISQLKDAMYDADDIIDLCRIEGAQLLAAQNPNSETSPTSSMVDDVVVGREVEVAANELVERLLAEKFEEKCRLFAVTEWAG